MKRYFKFTYFLNRQRLAFIVALLLPLALVVIVRASGYSLTWSTVDGGGGTLNSGGYILTSAIGQPDAAASLSNGDYTLTGGVLVGIARSGHDVYLPTILRN